MVTSGPRSLADERGQASWRFSTTIFNYPQCWGSARYTDIWVAAPQGARVPRCYARGDRPPSVALYSKEVLCFSFGFLWFALGFRMVPYGYGLSYGFLWFSFGFSQGIQVFLRFSYSFLIAVSWFSYGFQMFSFGFYCFRLFPLVCLFGLLMICLPMVVHPIKSSPKNRTHELHGSSQGVSFQSRMEATSPALGSISCYHGDRRNAIWLHVRLLGNWVRPSCGCEPSWSGWECPHFRCLGCGTRESWRELRLAIVL